METVASEEESPGPRAPYAAEGTGPPSEAAAGDDDRSEIGDTCVICGLEAVWDGHPWADTGHPCGRPGPRSIPDRCDHLVHNDCLQNLEEDSGGTEPGCPGCFLGSYSPRHRSRATTRGPRPPGLRGGSDRGPEAVPPASPALAETSPHLHRPGRGPPVLPGGPPHEGRGEPAETEAPGEETTGLGATYAAEGTGPPSPSPPSDDTPQGHHADALRPTSAGPVQADGLATRGGRLPGGTAGPTAGATEQATTDGTRPGLQAALFRTLDHDGNGRLSNTELGVLAQALGFDGGREAWAREYHDLCRRFGNHPDGIDAAGFALILDGDDAFYQSDLGIAETEAWCRNAGTSRQPLWPAEDLASAPPPPVRRVPAPACLTPRPRPLPRKPGHPGHGQR